MKVKTDIKAGNIFDDISSEAQSLYSNVAGYINSAVQDAEGEGKLVAQKAEQLWGCISSVL